MSEANYIYSKSANIFYAVSERTAYEAAGSWPTDGVEVTDEEFQTYNTLPPSGKQRGADNSGKPTWVDIPDKSVDELYEEELSALNVQYELDKKNLRDSYLNAMLFDGPNEDSKRTAIYNQLQQRQQKYATDVDNLNNKYGGTK